jgi:hypothetical protein
MNIELKKIESLQHKEETNARIMKMTQALFYSSI